MPVSPTYPGVYIEEIPSGIRSITGVGTSIAAFVGKTACDDNVNEPISIYGYGEYENLYGGLDNKSALSFAVRDFFLNGGSHAIIVNLGSGTIQKADVSGSLNNKTGIYALEKADLFTILCIPPYDSDDVDKDVWTEASAYCEKKRAFLIVDPKDSWDSKSDVKSGYGSYAPKSANAALYFPRLKQPNPLKDNQIESFVPCGAIAGIMARTDSNRGIWKAPAGLDAVLKGVPALSVSLTDGENGELNQLGINCLRVKQPAGRIVWGARTMKGADQLASEWKYIPVRRLALNIEESLFRGSQWAVFEPNDEPLWAQMRLNIGSYMHGLFRRGAFQGSSPKEAYFVKCDSETTTQTDIDNGKVNVVVGFAPLKPAEFVILKIQQIAGQNL